MWAGFREHPVLWVSDTPILPLGYAERHPRVSPAEAVSRPERHRCGIATFPPDAGHPAPCGVLSQAISLVHPGPQQLRVFLAGVPCRHNSSPPEETNLLASCLLWRDAAPGSSPPPASHVHCLHPRCYSSSLSC